METFKFNDTNVRFFDCGEDVYFITSDTNSAFGFDGENTRLDKLSVRFDTLAENMQHIFSAENLAKNTRIILLSELIKGVVKSSNPELERLADVFVQLAAKGFLAARAPRDRPLLPPMPSDKRMINSAISAKLPTISRKKRRARGEYAGWNTARGLVCKLVPDPRERKARLNNGKLMWGLRAALAAEYSATTGAKPPKVTSYNCKTQGLGYPPTYEELVKAYLLGFGIQQHG